MTATKFEVTANLASAIRARRTACGMSQSSLAELAGCDQQYIARLEARRVETSRWLQPVLTVLSIDLNGKPISETVGVAHRISERLRVVKKSPSAVSLEAGLNRAAVRDIIANDANPRIDTLQKLAGPLQCDLSFLTEGTQLRSTSADAADLLAFLHYVRAEHGIDVPERHFEMLRALKAHAPSIPEASK